MHNMFFRFLSYSGPFNQEFRGLLIKSWLGELLRRKIPVSMNLHITEELTDTATVRNDSHITLICLIFKQFIINLVFDLLRIRLMIYRIELSFLYEYL